MFEKEAKEYEERKHYRYEDNDYCGDIADGIIQAYQQGAEFGYNKSKEELNQNGLALQSDMDKTIEQNIALKKELNKANEWHFVKDGDLPKIGKRVLSEKGDLVIYKGDGFNWVEYSPNTDNIKLRKWEEPRAWKEIVLPKESE